MVNLFLVRHGATEWNLAKRAQGQADIELTDEGVRQAEAVAHELVPFGLAVVYTSDLKRALATAHFIAEASDIPVVEDPRLREIDQGEWTGLEVDEIRRRWPDMWGPARHYSARPGGESPDQVRTRALDAVRAIVEEHEGSSVAAVSHGGTIRWLSAEALGYDDRRSARIRGLGNGGVVRIEAHMKDGQLLLSGLHRLDGATPDLDDPND